MNFRNKDWRSSMRLTVDYNYMMKKFIGEDGFKDSELSEMKEMAADAFDYVADNRGKGMMGWTELPYNQKEIVDDIIATAKEVRRKYKYFVVLGIGGSALGPIAVFNALCHLHYNDLAPSKRKGPKFYVEDNVDPERMAALLDVIEPEKTCFNVITKSGATSETMTQYLVINDILTNVLGDKASEHIIATTDEKKGNLIKLAKQYNYKTFYIPDGVGGRFSELCPVGLLPAAVLGLDIKAMLAGAAYMDGVCNKPSIARNPALACAVLQYMAMKRGKNVGVMMPYADSLKLMSDWYCQLWAESLGKNVTLDGKPCNVGQTPVKSLGVTDQHSQVQLYTEGPFDKVVTFLSVENYRKEVVIPHGCEDIPDVCFLGGHTMNELIAAENKATAYALAKAGRQNYTIWLPEVNEFTLGELMYLFELQTAYTGAMFNIDTFNQPGVEAGKQATYALLGKPGYEAKKKELDDAPAAEDKYRV